MRCILLNDSDEEDKQENTTTCITALVVKHTRARQMI